MYAILVPLTLFKTDACYFSNGMYWSSFSKEAKKKVIFVLLTSFLYCWLLCDTQYKRVLTTKWDRKGDSFVQSICDQALTKKWREILRWSHQSLKEYVCFVGVDKARRLAIKKLPLNLAKNWYSWVFLSFFPLLSLYSFSCFFLCLDKAGKSSIH